MRLIVLIDTSSNSHFDYSFCAQITGRSDIQIARQKDSLKNVTSTVPHRFYNKPGTGADMP